ncbi:MAG: LamG domain-containing protein [Sandaracinaceae bacterium]|nr:LamG domain-containing protein [Sandaracinaceae bacterium]
MSTSSPSLGLGLAAGLALSLSALGCAENAGTPVEASALCAEVARVVCEADARCFDGSMTRATCLEAQRDACEPTVGALADDQRLAYDPGRAGAFLASLEESAQSCWARPIDHDAFLAIFEGTGQEGADCTPSGTSASALRISALSCADGNACRLHLRVDGSPEGVCEARNDGACSHPLDCEAGSYCSLPGRWQPGAWGECRPRRTNGWACTSDLECQSLHCDGVCAAITPDQIALEVSYTELVEASAPALYLRLGESSGARVDAMGGPSAAASGGTVSREAEGAIEGDTNAAARLTDGSYLRVATPASLSDSEELTLECWFRADDTSHTAPLLEIEGETMPAAHVWQFDSGSKIFANFVGADEHGHTVMSDADAVSADAWHHVVATYDGMHGTLYLDGHRIGETAMSGGLLLGDDFLVGHRNAIGEGEAASFSGAIDEVAVYDHALSAATITRHHSAGTDGPVTNTFPLFAWLR